MAVAGALFDTVTKLEQWAKPIRQALRREPMPPSLPAWFDTASAAMLAGSDQSPSISMNVPETTDTPPRAVDVTETAKAVPQQIADLRTSLAAITTTLQSVELIDRELRAERVDHHGRTGRFVEPNPRNRPLDEARLRFARRLNRDWQRAGRSELQATDIALAAVYGGLDDLRKGQDALVARWAAQIRRDKVRSEKVLLEEKKAAKPKTTRQRTRDR